MAMPTLARIKPAAGWCPRMGDTGEVVRIDPDPAEEYPVVVRFRVAGREPYDLILSYRRREVELIKDGVDGPATQSVEGN